MGHYGYEAHDRQAEEAAHQMDAEMQRANDLAAQAANDENMQADYDEAMAKQGDDLLFEEARGLIGDALANMRAVIISEPSVAASLTPVMERLDDFWMKTSRS